MADKPNTEAKKSNIKKIIPIVLMAFNIIGLGVGGYFTYAATLGWVPPKVTNEQLMPKVEKNVQAGTWHPIVFTMDPFTVNLDGLPRRVLHLEINLRMLNEEGFEEVISLGAEVRDAIIRLLNQKTYSDLETIQGKLLLKDQIGETVNGYLKLGVVKDVYFTKLNVAIR